MIPQALTQPQDILLLQFCNSIPHPSSGELGSHDSWCIYSFAGAHKTFFKNR